MIGYIIFIFFKKKIDPLSIKFPYYSTLLMTLKKWKFLVKKMKNMFFYYIMIV
jgi:hypothetical protein